MYRIIPNYPNYEVDEDGNVRNVKTQRVLKNWNMGSGYRATTIINEKGQKRSYIHRIVALTWISEQPDGCNIDHIDRNKLNNNVSNLRWVSFSKNSLNRNRPPPYKNKEHHHITVLKNGKFYVVLTKNKEKTRKYCQTLEEAIIFRDENL
jgi:hypothetical protein